MRFVALLALLTAGCVPPAVATFHILAESDGAFVACSPTTDWTEPELLERCGPPAAALARTGDVRCLVYDTQDIGTAAERIAVCTGLSGRRVNQPAGHRAAGRPPASSDEAFGLRFGSRSRSLDAGLDAPVVVDPDVRVVLAVFGLRRPASHLPALAP